MSRADATAFVSARSHYIERARALREQAMRQNDSDLAKFLDYQSKIAQRAAIAELVNEQPK